MSYFFEKLLQTQYQWSKFCGLAILVVS